MAALTLTQADLAPFAVIDPAKAQAMIADALALAVLAAPCLADESKLTDAQVAAARAIMRGAVLRWNDTGSGAMQSQTAGPFGVAFDTRQPRKSMYWPSEIEDLQKVCLGVGAGAAFTIDTAPTASYSLHLPWCSLNLGADWCSCGVDIAGVPIYELGSSGP